VKHKNTLKSGDISEKFEFMAWKLKIWCHNIENQKSTSDHIYMMPSQIFDVRSYLWCWNIFICYIDV
jgi:hypothetical protein